MTERKPAAVPFPDLSGTPLVPAAAPAPVTPSSSPGAPAAAPAHLTETVAKLARIRVGLAQELGREPTVDELAQRMELPLDKLRKILELAPPVAAAPAARPEPVAALQVGEEIEAYCPSERCSRDTAHTIISMYEDEIRRAQCVQCGEVHAYRKPRGAPADGTGTGTGTGTGASALTDEQRENLYRSVDELEVSVRTANSFLAANLRYVGELARMTESDYLALPNFGAKSLAEIKEILSELGLHMGMDVGGWTPPAD